MPRAPHADVRAGRAAAELEGGWSARAPGLAPQHRWPPVGACDASRAPPRRLPLLTRPFADLATRVVAGEGLVLLLGGGLLLTVHCMVHCGAWAPPKLVWFTRDYVSWRGLRVITRNYALRYA